VVALIDRKTDRQLLRLCKNVQPNRQMARERIANSPEAASMGDGFKIARVICPRRRNPGASRMDYRLLLSVSVKGVMEGRHDGLLPSSVGVMLAALPCRFRARSLGVRRIPETNSRVQWVIDSINGLPGDCWFFVALVIPS